ncbi:MAG: HEAT repeat domain-containing protein [Deltaproteobacteria bacterium]|nr:HEAT repeat domain-containing protein [Deltaproteobacteria bacterium]
MTDTAKLGTRALKRKVLDLLRSDTFDRTLPELSHVPARQLVNPLISFLFSKDEEIKWGAVSALGHVVADLAGKDMESARVVMRRLMWMLNDESGGIGWGAPEAMGEIVASHDGLAKEFAPVLISYVWEDGNSLEYEPLQRGAVWGLGRVAQTKPGTVRGAIPHLIVLLRSSDAIVRGLAAWTLGLLRAEAARSRLEGLLEDDAEIPIYIDRNLTRWRVSDLAEEALTAIAP